MTGHNMPHSSGGGSHGGGSFSGSHSFSGGSGSRSAPTYPRISNTYHAGYHRYVVYHALRPTYFYARSPITEKDARPHLAGPAAMVLFALIFLAVFLAGSYHRPKKLPQNYDTAIRVADRANVLSGGDEALLNSVFTRFREETGITPAFLAVSPDEWKGRYSGFSNFAYDAYVNLFRDESHWLLCYSGDPSADFDDWVWEGMQGDNTDGILSEKLADRFTKNVQKYLTARSRYTVGQAVSQGMEDILPDMMKPGFRFDSDELQGTVILVLLVLGVGLFNLVSAIRAARQASDKVGAVQCPTDKGKVQEDTCEYCGGVYVHGVHLQCPHCGAAVKAAET